MCSSDLLRPDANIESFNKIGIDTTEQQLNAYIHVWRLAGHYLGIMDNHNFCTSFESVQIALESVSLRVVQPDKTFTELSTKVLVSIRNNSIIKFPLDMYKALFMVILDEKKIFNYGMKKKLAIKLYSIPIKVALLTLFYLSKLGKVKILSTYVKYINSTFVKWMLKPIPKNDVPGHQLERVNNNNNNNNNNCFAISLFIFICALFLLWGWTEATTAFDGRLASVFN